MSSFIFKTTLSNESDWDKNEKSNVKGALMSFFCHLQMANDSTETSEAGEEEEDHEGDNENKERMPFIQ